MTEGAAWKFTIWGSRGSVPVSSRGIREYGGQTTCLELELPDARIIIDAGSGLVELGHEKPDTRETLLFMTHVHWDHIVGFPFFSRLFEKEFKIDVRGVPRANKSVIDAIYELNKPPIFPVRLDDLVRANLVASDLEERGEFDFHGAKVEWIPVTHPGGCSGVALSYGGKRIVFTGDVEIPAGAREELVEFARGADVLICDAQYTTEEYKTHIGWGHSTNIDAAALAKDAGVGQLLLTHHDPVHTDEQIDAMVEEAQGLFANTLGAKNRMVVAEG
ncbi:MAG: phosphoribosyl 1,2-cyclic phosphodiesterase [Bradymonadia bacterium]|jgi:phosphoribosyl 1,2-cyclic phosphodiesterase